MLAAFLYVSCFHQPFHAYQHSLVDAFLKTDARIAQITSSQVAKLAVSIVMYYCKFLGVDRAEVIKLLIAENAIIDSDAVRVTRAVSDTGLHALGPPF